MKRFLLRQLRTRYNYDLVPADDLDQWWTTLIGLLREHAVDVAIDVGANDGDFASDLRYHGFDGQIVSFEPLKTAYDRLRVNAENDARWDCHNLALGATDATVTMNVANNDQRSSSLLSMLDAHVSAAPDARNVGRETVTMKPLDSVSLPTGRMFLKLDVQGYEAEVLKGAERLLSRVQILCCELSLRPLYEGQPLIAEMLEQLSAKGYVLVKIRRGFRDPRTGEILQIDGLFKRSFAVLERDGAGDALLEGSRAP